MPPVHRNHGKTAPTHVKDASGLWYVHDGTGAVVELPGRPPLAHLTYDEARKAKDLAVTKYKMRKAGVRKHLDGAPEAPDPYIVSVQRKAVAAARPAARAAQVRHEAKAAAAPKTPIVGLDPIDLDPIPGSDDADLAFDDSDVEEVLAGGNRPTPDDVARARAQAESDAAYAEKAGRELFERELAAARTTGAVTTPALVEAMDAKGLNGISWDKLREPTRAAYRWRALNESTEAPV